MWDFFFFWCNSHSLVFKSTPATMSSSVERSATSRASVSRFRSRLFGLNDKDSAGWRQVAGFGWNWEPCRVSGRLLASDPVFYGSNAGFLGLVGLAGLGTQNSPLQHQIRTVHFGQIFFNFVLWRRVNSPRHLIFL